jgi:hypothetical protein
MVKMKPTLIIYAVEDGPPGTAPAPPSLGPVVSDRFDRATFHCFLAKTFFFGRLGLFVDVGVTAVVVPLKISGRSFPAKIAVDALLIDIEFAGSVLGIFVGNVGHDFVR